MISATPSGFAVVDAVRWTEQVLLGSIATSVAVLAVAVLGLMMLGGRLPARRGANAVIGCFILFSASTIANGLLAALGERPSSERAEATVLAPQYLPAMPKPMPRDPNAGASVSDQRAADIFK